MERFDLGTWFRRYGEAVERRCRRLLRDEAQAQDALQEAFLRAHRYAHSYRGDASPLAWLFRIADRVCLDAIAKEKRQGVPLEEEDMSALEDEATPSPERLALRQAAARRALALGDGLTQQILIHRYFDELSSEEIAARLGTTDRTVRRKLSRFFARAERALQRRPVERSA